jgi:MoaA/NifB/PqqE/SkfB family radical SAM enzyme
MTNLPKTVCILPWVSIETSPIGTVRPCCMAIDEIIDENDQKYDLNQTNLETVYQSKYMQDLRKQFRNGEKPKTCQRCWDEEDAGRASKRIHTKVRLKKWLDKVDYENDQPNQLWFLDLKLGNICNLKCRICGSWSSSKWAEEEIKYMPELEDKKSHLAYKMLKLGQWPRKTETFWDNLRQLLKNVKYFEFTGGEPWLIEEHFDLLRFAVSEGLSHDIEIHYNTNATTWDESFVDIWKNFKRVDIAFSIDNVGNRFEYERYGAEWNKANEIIDRVMQLQSENSVFTTQLCFTINILNVYYINEILEWADTKNFTSIYFNMLHGPEEFSIQTIPDDAKEKIANHLSSIEFKLKYKAEINNVIRFMQNGISTDGDGFRKKIKQTDSYRSQFIGDTHPELAKIMSLMDE